MFCPKCATEQISKQTIFCSKCGLRLTEIASIVDGPRTASSGKANMVPLSPRKKGLFQTYLAFLFAALIFIAGIIIHAYFGTDTRSFVIASMILIVTGIFRAVYALLFESNQVRQLLNDDQILEPAQPKAISAVQTIPTSDFFDPQTDRARTTRELAVPLIVEETTKALKIKNDP